jgi:flavorubredoxin
MNELTDLEVLEALIHLLELDDNRQLMLSGHFLIVSTILDCDSDEDIEDLSDADRKLFECLNDKNSALTLKAVLNRLKLANILEG